MQRHATTQSLAQRARTLAASFAVLLFGTAFYSHNVQAQTGGNIPASASYACDFENSYCDFNEHSKLEPTGRRSSFTSAAANGVRGVKLTTLVGDNNIHGSGTWERNDLSKGPDASYCNAGQEEWWAFSIMFPDDYVFPPGPEAGIIMDFHHNASSGQANYEIQTIPGIGLRARGYGGSAINTGKFDALIPDPYGAVNNVTKNQWYHFVLHVRWSSNGDGLMEGWLNGKKYQSYQGPTLYSGISCYLKLANYHGPFGQASSLIHDRVVRGATANDVTLMALEGVAGTGSAPAPVQPTTYALSTVTMGSGTGTVTSSPSGISCGSSCSSSFAANTAVTLTASPAAGSTFAGWSGSCSGTGGCTVTMSGAKSVTATFNTTTAPAAPVSTSPVAVSASTLYFTSGVRSSQTVTYTNNSSSTVQFLQASMSSGRYQQTNNCDAVAPGGSCSATVTYYPTNSGSDTATFTVTSNAPNSPHVVNLTTSAPPATTTPVATTNAVVVSASTLTFGATSSTQTVTFTNKTGKTVQFIRASMSSGKYQQTNNCDAVAVGASCQAKVTYYPSNSGSTTGTLTVTSDAPNSPHVITLKSNSSKPRVVG
jgi:hypothetical protein